jgi:mannose-6-phosphate isomerase-like protein (cupin superfamily)
MHIKDLESKAMDNTTFRTVLATSKHTQVVVMDVKPGEDISKEIHPNEDQKLYLVSSKETIYMDGDGIVHKTKADAEAAELEHDAH